GERKSRSSSAGALPSACWTIASMRRSSWLPQLNAPDVGPPWSGGVSGHGAPAPIPRRGRGAIAAASPPAAPEAQEGREIAVAGMTVVGARTSPIRLAEAMSTSTGGSRRRDSALVWRDFVALLPTFWDDTKFEYGNPSPALPLCSDGHLTRVVTSLTFPLAALPAATVPLRSQPHTVNEACKFFMWCDELTVVGTSGILICQCNGQEIMQKLIQENELLRKRVQQLEFQLERKTRIAASLGQAISTLTTDEADK
ncbi:hypothetical protein Taro_034142, partial [Colocasia esculenta]|nr:hypothetical protein [Colocasia esculenta]